jgi:anti-sigma-K factor RskA
VVKTMHDDLHLLAGSYALDALSEADRDSFERHLQHCGPCEAEVRGYREAAARLGLARATDPPSAMREQVLAAAYRTRQLPPLAGSGLDRASRRERLLSAVSPAGRGRLLSAVSPAGRGRPRSAVFPAARDAAPDRRRPRVPRVLAAAVAACAAAGIALGVVSQVTAPPKTPAAISSVLGASDARRMTVATVAGGTVTAVVSWDKREAVVTTAGLASLPALKVYQLWVMGPAGTTEARSAGLLSRASHAGPVLAAALRPGDRLGITVEPAGGTEAPTTPPVVVMPLPA